MFNFIAVCFNYACTPSKC